MKAFFDSVFYTPIYNGLVGLIDIVPYADVGIAVILLTVLVKLVLYPLSVKLVKTQMLMKELEPELKEIREKYKSDRTEQTKRMLELYSARGLSPFTGVLGLLLILIQLPIVLALYFVFASGGLPEIYPDLLYSFVPTPERVNMLFLGLVDMASRNWFLALLAGVTQYVQIKLSLPEAGPRKENASMQEDFARSFQFQMRYIMPAMVGGIAFVSASAVALYWATSNIFAIGQELVIRKTVKNKALSNT